MVCVEAVLSVEDSKKRVLIYEPMFKAAKLLLEMRSRVTDIYSPHWQEESAQPKKRWLWRERRTPKARRPVANRLALECEYAWSFALINLSRPWMTSTSK